MPLGVIVTVNLSHAFEQIVGTVRETLLMALLVLRAGILDARELRASGVNTSALASWIVFKAIFGRSTRESTERLKSASSARSGSTDPVMSCNKRSSLDQHTSSLQASSAPAQSWCRAEKTSTQPSSVIEDARSPTTAKPVALPECSPGWQAFSSASLRA
jgi:hypothetical protein